MTDNTNPNLPAVRSARELTPSTWQMIEAIAPAMHQSRLFGVSSHEQAMAIMLKGYELGLTLTASFEFVQVVEGKPALSPRGCLALIHNSPLCAGLKIEDLTDNKGNPIGCRVWMKRSNGFEHTVTWTMEDAKRAGIVKPNSGWEKYPANMLKWRAVGFCADVVFPDVIGGLKRADEYGADLTPDGDVVEGSWTTSPTSPGTETEGETPEPTQPATDSCSTPSLSELVQQYGAEAVMEANDGRIPGTDKELIQVAEALEAENAS